MTRTLTTDQKTLMDKISQNNSSKRNTYNTKSNPKKPFDIHRKNIPEYIRSAFTRFRLSSHHLRIKTG